MTKPILAIAAALLAGAVVAPTVSQAQDVSSARVSYADLNLGAAPGQKALQRRIGIAADTLCGVNTGRENAIERAATACRTGAVASARPAFEAAVAAARRGSVTVLDAAALIVTAH